MTDAADIYRDTWGTLVDPPETADERQAAIVAWLREQYSGKLQSAVYLADAIELGEWKGQG